MINLTDELGDFLGLYGILPDVFWDIPEHLFFGCVIGQMGLLGVWLALGRSPLPRRLGLVLWISACLWTLWAFAQIQRRPDLARNLQDAADAGSGRFPSPCSWLSVRCGGEGADGSWLGSRRARRR